MKRSLLVLSILAAASIASAQTKALPVSAPGTRPAAGGSGAIYIVDQKDPAASDTNAGTADKPFKTISAAVAKLQVGDTVTVKAGTYREGVKLPVGGSEQQRVTIQAADGETVVINGADLVSGWQQVPDEKKRPIWKKAPFAPWKKIKQLRSGQLNREEGPQVIVDGLMFTRVSSVDDLVAGSFFWDPSGDGSVYLYMFPPRTGEQKMAKGDWWDSPVNLATSDPNEHQVELSVRHASLEVNGLDYVTVRGFVLRYSTGSAQQGNLHVDGNHNITEDCVTEYSHGRGMTTSGDRCIVRRNYTRFNGASGGGAELSNSLYEDNVLDSNTTAGHSHGWEAGGIKFGRAYRTIIRGNQAINNNGPGIWLDFCNNGNILERNYCSFNYGAGLMLEITPRFSGTQDDAQPSPYNRRVKDLKWDPNEINIVRNNICVGNRWDGFIGSGILLQLASKCIVANNTCVDNEQYGIFLRYHPYNDMGDRVVDDVLINNICANNKASQIYISPSPADKPGMVKNNRSDYNLFYDVKAWNFVNETSRLRDFGVDRVRYSLWGKTQIDSNYSLTEWTKIYGFDAHSIQADPMLVSPDSRDYRLQSGSPAIGAGEATPHVTDDYYGNKRPEGAPSMGAIEYSPDRLKPMPRP